MKRPLWSFAAAEAANESHALEPIVEATEVVSPMRSRLLLSALIPPTKGLSSNRSKKQPTPRGLHYRCSPRAARNCRVAPPKWMAQRPRYVTAVLHHRSGWHSGHASTPSNVGLHFHLQQQAEARNCSRLCDQLEQLTHHRSNESWKGTVGQPKLLHMGRSPEL